MTSPDFEEKKTPNAISNQTSPPKSLLRAIIFKLPAPLIIITITILSSRSSLPTVQWIPGLDKIMHFSVYTVLSIAIGLWFSRSSWLKHPKRNFFLCTVITSFYGVLDEVHQYFVPGRSADILDWVADILGGAFGAAIVLIFVRILESRKVSICKK